MLKASELKPQTIQVDFQMVYGTVADPITGRPITQGRQVTFILQLLSKHRWEEIGLTVDDPIPDMKANGDYDYMGMAYQKRSTRATYDRNTRRLCEALERGGAFDFEGAETWEEKVATLREIDGGVFHALFTELQNATFKFEARVSAAVAAFPSTNGKRSVQKSEVKDNVTPPEPVPSVG